MKKEKVIKAVGWRIIATSITAFVAFFITGDTTFAITIGGIDTIFKLVGYYLYDEMFDRLKNKPFPPSVIWMTGTSGSGKTTLADYINETLTRWGNKVVVLDADRVKKMFPVISDEVSYVPSFSKTIAYMASDLQNQGVTVIVALISPKAESRQEAREINNSFYEVYIHQDDSNMQLVTKSNYQKPQSPDMTICTTDRTVEDCALQIINTVKFKEMKKDHRN